ncbi:hypothetical protein CB0940_03173 [Cercospora beticola]|uniref:Uncharacterized protein n=1 Tax=Cercospora beticola TaxID=122368 RepID=A0A2G5I5H6_CERBT|nr:hypothetical protein CB0940_03173 [Cercospora beticola]PIB00060.1 hypothetical protein CB0940_03173 [Cercospora beticola]WPB00342.1 hypothetical protein RHO25_004961 [Cercospora beticola]
MSYSQQFQSRLLQQLNDTNSRNLELQSLLAQKDDQLATLTARAGPGAGSNAGGNQNTINQLRRTNADTLAQLRRAEETATAAEAQVKSNLSRFQKIEADLRQQIGQLQRDLRQRDQQLKDRGSAHSDPRKGAHWTASTGVAPRAELDSAKAEVKRLRNALGSLQRQFEREKREASQHRDLPAANPEKLRQIEDQDDEETVLNLKQEPGTELPAPPIGNFTYKDTNKTESSKASNPSVAPPQVLPIQTRKRMRSGHASDEPGPSALKKARVERKDSDSGESEEEIDGDADFCLDGAAPPAKQAITNRIDIKDLQERFEFQAVTQHYPTGDIDAFHSKEDLSDECEELWARIKKQVDEWEEAKGEDWSFEFQKPGYKLVNPPCITTKLKGKGGKSQWRPGCEGKFTCRKCVEEERPCFTWNGEEFWLLPLHEQDRKWPVEEGSEIRYWLNVE